MFSYITLHGRASVGRPNSIDLWKLCPVIGCSLEDMPEAINDRNEWREFVWETCDRSTIYIYHTAITNISEGLLLFVFIIHLFQVVLKTIYIYIYIVLRIIYIYIYIYIYHHHHVVLVAWISLTLSGHISLSFIALGRSSGQHPVFSHSCWMYVRADRPAPAWPCVRVHRNTSRMSSSLLLQQCPACLVRLNWILFVIGSRWPCSFVGCCRQDLFKIDAAFLCNCRLAFSPAVLLESM